MSERNPPRERFAQAALEFDLRLAAAQLESEEDKGQSGHRQVVLYKHERATIALFRFEKGGAMPEHKAPGSVFIQVLEGRFTFEVAGQRHSLQEGGLLVLAPGVVHDVKAEEKSLMLLTVCLEN